VPQIKTKRAAALNQLAERRVLVVEDSELNQDVAVALLGEAGLIVETVENGKLAVEKVTGSPRGRYDAVLMDIQMPVMDGYEATRRIRAREFKVQHESSDVSTNRPPITDHRIPIIALTAHALKGEKEKCLAADMDDYLSKPLDERELFRVLLKWIATQPEEADTANRQTSRRTTEDQDVLDVQGALKRLGGRRQLYDKVLRKFESDSVKVDAIIARHIACSDLETAARVVHTIKGMAATVGAVDLSQVAAKLETAIRDNSLEIGGLLSVFKNALDKTLQSVKELFEAESES
jgi:CheY-like chemotaxis protein